MLETSTLATVIMSVQNFCVLQFCSPHW